VSDADLVQRIAQDVGLRVQVEPTNQIHPYVLQNNETNLDFLRGRVAALGYLLYVRGNTLHCAPPESNASPVALEWGRTLTEFRPRLTTLHQVNGVTVRGWDPSQKLEIVGRAQNGHGAPQVGDGKAGGEVALAAFNLEAPSLITDRPMRTQAAADRFAQAVADRIAGGFIEADGTCGGNPSIFAGASVQLSAVGQRFGGTYFVTAATHLYSATHGYTTQFSVSGHRPATLVGMLAPDTGRPLLNGLVIGIVTDNDDPNGEGRVKVKYPSLSADHASDWARVVVPGGGKERGIEFLPEINDEVLVGFELGDVHCPYVLGGLWNGMDAPPGKNGEVVGGGKVKKRVIRSRTGHVITLDDDDAGGGITIEDKNGNKMARDSASNALTIEIKGDASLKADGKLTLEAKGKVEIKGMGATMDAGAGSVEVKGMGAKVDAGAASVDVKGSMINLN
jgi:hypothetical protein